MTFEDKVTFLRNLPQFRVIPISEGRAIAFAAKEEGELDDLKLGEFHGASLFLSREDIEKILREYPDLAPKLK